MPSGGPAGASSNFPGQNASVYTPTAQPQADTLFQNTLFNTFGPLATNPSSSPGGQAYNSALGFFGSGGLSDTNNPYLTQALQGQSGAYNSFLPFSGPSTDPQNPAYLAMLGGSEGAAGAAPGLFSSGTANSGYLGNSGVTALEQAFGNPGLGADPAMAGNLTNFGNSIINTGFNNPNDQRDIAAGTDLGNRSSSILQTGFNNPLYGFVNPAVSRLYGSGNSILDTAFDPRGDLYASTLDKVNQQQAAANAFSGVGGSPYGASLRDDNIENFNIDWQNQQLGRQATGLGAAGAAFGQGGALSQLPLAGQATALGAALPGYAGASSLFGAPQGREAAALGAGGNAYNSAGSLYQQPLAGMLSGLSGAGQAFDRSQSLGAGAAGNYANLTGLPFNVYNSGANNAYTQLSRLSGLSGQPYSTYATGVGNTLSGLSSLTNLGNNQYQIPQQAINDIDSYLGLGQSASNISGSLGNMGLQQLQNSLSGFGGAAGNLLGSNGPFSSGGLLSGLNPFGGGGAGGVSAADLASGVGNLGPAAAAAGDFGGGGDLLASAAPLALSG